MSEPPPKRRSSVAFMNNLELILTMTGMILIVLMPRLLGSKDPWYVMALTASFFGVIQGMIFWVIRRRQRQIRQDTIMRVRAMLQDMVKNQLSVIMTSTHLATRAPNKDVYVARIDATVRDISAALDSVSEESLRKWQHRYDTGPLRSRDTDSAAD